MSLVRTAALIVAGGTGERLGLPGGKQLAVARGKPVLLWTLTAFEAAPDIDLIVVVCPENRVDEYRRAAVDPLHPKTPVHFAPSGATRQQSVENGLKHVPAHTHTVVVHDGARPLVTPALIADALAAFHADPDADGLVVGAPAVDTLKIVLGDTVVKTPDRSRYWAVQTPQIFPLDTLTAAYVAADADGFLATDDASLVEHAGGKVIVFTGPRDNIKVTVAEDLFFLEAALKYREGGDQ